MGNTVTKQPGEDKAFDIDMSNELKRSDEVISSVISIDDDDSVLTYGTVTIPGSAKLLRVAISGGVDGVTYKVTVNVVTNYSPIIEKEFYVSLIET